MWSAVRLILGWFIFLFLGCISIVIAPGGASNFHFFINFEAMLLLFGGTFLWGWMSWGVKGMFKAIFIAIKSPSFSYNIHKWDESMDEMEKAKTVLSGLRNASLAIGMVVTLLEMILMLGTIDDVAQIPKKFAIALTAIFLAILLSEVFFGSLLSRVTAPGETIPSQRGYIYSLLLLVMLSFFVLLYAINAALNTEILTLPEVQEYLQKQIVR